MRRMFAAPRKHVGNERRRADANGPNTSHAVADESATTIQTVPPPLAIYMGRRIAAPMSYMGADWLIRESVRTR